MFSFENKKAIIDAIKYGNSIQTEVFYSETTQSNSPL